MSKIVMLVKKHKEFQGLKQCLIINVF
jgi:hypothetical protein